jgi:hypothetical protein
MCETGGARRTTPQCSIVVINAESMGSIAMRVSSNGASWVEQDRLLLTRVQTAGHDAVDYGY